MLVDVRAGRVTRRLEGLSPVLGVPSAVRGLGASAAAGSPATRLFLDDRGVLVEVDPVSAERRQVLPIRRAN